MHRAQLRRARLATCLWPGLAQLWWRGQWRGLAAAVGFTVLINLLLLTSLVWTEWTSPSVRLSGWVVLAVVWTTSALIASRWCARLDEEPESSPQEDLFPRALGEYLRGNWFEAEDLCRKRLRQDARDADTLLLLATTLRLAGRTADARQRLAELTRLDAAEKWKWEIEQERQRLAEAEDLVPAHTIDVAQQPPSRMLGAA